MAILDLPGMCGVTVRPESIMLENLPKMLLGISQKFPLLCSIMLTELAVSYV